MLLPEMLPLRAIDRAVQRFVRERDPAAHAWLLDAAGLASYQVGQGHACIDLARLPVVPSASQPLVEHLQGQPFEQLRDCLLASTLVSGDQCISRPDALFVLDGSRFYLRRYWDFERAVIDGIHRRLAIGFSSADGLSSELDRLFPAARAPGDDIDWQRIACAVAAGSRFAVVTGGPGTGKTTTVVRMLGLLQTRAMRAGGMPLRIRLAAPTGKAAARLSDAIGRQLADLAVPADVRKTIPADVSTVHRLLGRRSGSRQPRHDAGEPLRLDVLVVDEASMLDLEMMAALLAALPDHAQLILLGDRDQLASVEAGSVFGDLCRRADQASYSAPTRDWIADASGTALPAGQGQGSALDQHIVMLRYSHRFKDDSGIGQLAAAANRGDARALEAVLGQGHHDLAWYPHGNESPISLAVTGYRPCLERIEQTRPAANAGSSAWLAWASAIVDAYGRFQLLAATREGPRGVAGLNARIAAALHALRLVDTSNEWYEGRPVMVTRNDYGLGLMNGDVGITLRMPAGTSTALRVAFPTYADPGTPLRIVSPARLPAVESVFAMTVHKSQGSEFDHAALVLPGEESAALSRELVYTAITRARSRFSLVGTIDIAGPAVQRKTQRASGLSAGWSGGRTQPGSQPAERINPDESTLRYRG
jgi:exodeoxyribonuclease V alpha subunit